MSLWVTSLTAMETSLLRESCKIGGFFIAYEGDKFKEEFDSHNQNSQKIIRELINSMKGGGTVVVLGPGLGSDLPLKELFIKFDKTILIDGYTDPLEAFVKTLPRELQKKVQILNEDLTGGFFALLEKDRQALKRAIAKDYLIFVSQGRGDFFHIRELINSKKLRLDLKQYTPSLVISSIVTSQILRLPDAHLPKLAEEMVSDTSDDATLQALAKILQFFDYNSSFCLWLNDFASIYWQSALTPYFKGIAESTAEQIYHSLDIKNIKETDSQSRNWELNTVRKEKEELAKFNNFMAPEYSIFKSRDNAWSYKADLLVSWQIWHKKPLPDAQQIIAGNHCSKCGKTQDLKRCKGCQKSYYCGPDCQKADWVNHKGSCSK